MKEKVAKCFRAISLGKYQTTLYNKTGSSYMSSVIGGIITLVLALVIGVYSVSLLTSIFGKDRYNLDMRSQEIRAYQLDDNGYLQKNLTSCLSDKCRDVLLKDWNEVTEGISFLIIGTRNESEIAITATLDNFDGDNQLLYYKTILLKPDTRKNFSLPSLGLLDRLTD
jgi:hypothetical protein